VISSSLTPTIIPRRPPEGIPISAKCPAVKSHEQRIRRNEGAVTSGRNRCNHLIRTVRNLIINIKYEFGPSTLLGGSGRG
jgi:hypothetical protein